MCCAKFFAHLIAFFFSSGERIYMTAVSLYCHCWCTFSVLGVVTPNPVTELLLHFWRNPILGFQQPEKYQSHQYIQPGLTTSILFWSEFAGAGGESCQRNLTEQTVLLNVHTAFSSPVQKPKPLSRLLLPNQEKKNTDEVWLYLSYLGILVRHFN